VAIGKKLIYYYEPSSAIFKSPPEKVELTLDAFSKEKKEGNIISV